MTNMRKFLLGLAVMLPAAGVNAEPYLAVRTGFKCSQCHVNPIGAGIRTDYGTAYTEYLLLMTQTQQLMKAQQGGQTSFDPKLNNSITVGGNFRMENVGTGSYSYADTNYNSVIAKGSNTFNVKEGNFFINIDLIKNFLNLYLDENIWQAPGPREVWAMVSNLPLNGYIKAGQMLLPYGLRLMDDDAFIRNKTFYTFNNPDKAVEVGLEPGPLSLTLNLTQNRFSSVGSLNFRNFRVGGSFGSGFTSYRQTFDQSYGPFVGANFGRFTLMSEVDFIRKPNNIPGLPNIHQLAEFYEVNFLPWQGFNVKGTYEYFDRNRDVSNTRDGQDRWTFGVEPFVARFLQLGVYYRINRFIPQSVGSDNQSMLITRAHVFF